MVSTGVISAIIVMALASSAPFARAEFPSYHGGLQNVQYNQYPGQPPDGYNDRQDQRRDGYNDRADQRRDGYSDRPDQRREGYNDRDYRGPKWRPGQVVPGPFLNRVVSDWEDRGLSRPPGGSQWLRVGQQFLLVRERDRMIARILNFD